VLILPINPNYLSSKN